jgi:hypothetical protein
MAPCWLICKGDQVPPPYPILDIHIPERTCGYDLREIQCICCFFAARVGPLEKKWAAEDRQFVSGQLAAVQQHLDANDELLKSQSEALASKIEHVAALAQSIVIFAGCVSCKSHMDTLFADRAGSGQHRIHGKGEVKM